MEAAPLLLNGSAWATDAARAGLPVFSQKVP